MGESMKYKTMRQKISEISQGMEPQLKKMFEACFYSSLDTATKSMEDGTIFMLTGDIPAMWLRDSAVQVMGYLPYAKIDNDVNALISGLIKRQLKYIILDPYANAFNAEPNNQGHKDDITDFDSPWIWERKFEIDSLCYPLWLIKKYYEQTKDEDIFDDLFYKALETILQTFETEQYHFEKSKYFHYRPKYPQFPTLPNEGRGNPVGYTGLIWNGYRPSDDVCDYGYLIPSNMFACVILSWLITLNLPQNLLKRADKLLNEINEGLERYAIFEHPKHGKIFAYEIDGLGGINLMDDANVPSLLSLPYLGYCKTDDIIYQNTRKFILSKDNPYYYEGKYGKGVGSPHTPEDYIWHIAIIMQLLTSDDKQEKLACFKTLMNTHAGKGVMHESFYKDDPKNFTREWFCWANTLFAMAVIDLKQENLI